MATLTLIPSSIKTPICRVRYIFYSLSAILVLASLALFFVRGLNYGIDFRGGTLIELSSASDIDLSLLRAQLGELKLGDVQAQHFGSQNEALVRIEGRGGEQTGRVAIEQKTVQKIRAALGEDYEFRRVETVGPKVSGELIRAGFFAVIAAVLLVLIYIWIRFEWQFSLGAVVALVHDVVLTIGVFSLLHFEFNLSIIAAILTIIGYSLNDTVVVYDRVRENLRKFRKVELDLLLDMSVAQTLSRTVMTSVTTLLALGALYIFGGAVIKGFAFAMIWGVITGTYSSIFIASPLLLALRVKREWVQPKLT